MRMLRPFTMAGTAALLALATAAAPAGAQASRSFTDSWFWGAKVGTMTFWTPTVNHAVAPMFGAEWMITRRRAALYLSGDQSYFDETSTYATFTSTGATSTADIQIKDMRRYTAALMAFPRPNQPIRPYAGLGMTLNVIRRATLVSGSLPSQALEDVQSTTAPILMLGAQGQYRRVALFGQGSYMPTQRRFLINKRSTFFLEAGVRYNVGSARESTH